MLITQQELEQEVNDKLDASHSHSNKAVIDKLTQSGTEATVDISNLATKDQLAELGDGDMKKSIYDTNNNSKVDIAETAESIDWANVQNKPSIPSTPSDIGAEPAFTKNTGFNKNLGTTADTVAEGNHSHALADLSEKSYNSLTDKPTIPTVDVDKAYVDAGLGSKANSSDLTSHINNGSVHLPDRLFEYCKNITDWNTATTNGFYMANGAANAPSGDWYFGIVTCHNPTWCEQRIVAFSSTRKEYVRYQLDTNWTAWQHVSIGDLNGLTFGSKESIVSSLNEVFQSVSSGKGLVATAITGKGVATSATATFQQMATNINNIKVGKYDIGDTLSTDKLQAFPSIVNMPCPISGSYQVSSVYLGFNNDLYVGYTGGYIYRYNLDGSVVWNKRYETVTVTGLRVVSGDLYACHTSGKALRLSANTGSQINTYTHDAGLLSISSNSQNDIFMGDNIGRGLKLRTNLSLVWTGNAGGGETLSCVGLNDGYSVFGTSQNFLASMNPSTGQQYQTANVSGQVYCMIYNDINNFFYSSTGSGYVYAHRGSGLEMRFGVKLPNSTYSKGMALNKDRTKLYVVAGDKNIYVLNPNTGDIISTISAIDKVPSYPTSMTLDDTKLTIYIGDQSGIVTGILDGYKIIK